MLTRLRPRGDLHCERQRVVDTKAGPTSVKAMIEAHLAGDVGTPVSPVVRSAADIAPVLGANPFKKSEPRHTYVIFLDERPSRRF